MFSKFKKIYHFSVCVKERVFSCVLLDVDKTGIRFVHFKLTWLLVHPRLFRLQRPLWIINGSEVGYSDLVNFRVRMNYESPLRLLSHFLLLSFGLTESTHLPLTVDNPLAILCKGRRSEGRKYGSNTELGEDLLPVFWEKRVSSFSSISIRRLFYFRYDRQRGSSSPM